MLIRRLCPGELPKSALKAFRRDQSVRTMYTQNMQVSEDDRLPGWELVPARGTYIWSEEEKEIVTEYLNSEERISFIAEDISGDHTPAPEERKLLGFSSIRRLTTVSGTSLLLDILYVDADHRGRGIGRKLFEAALLSVREISPGPLYITADPAEESVRFYLNAGAGPVKNAPKELISEEPGNLILQISLS